MRAVFDLGAVGLAVGAFAIAACGASNGADSFWGGPSGGSSGSGGDDGGEFGDGSGGGSGSSSGGSSGAGDAGGPASVAFVNASPSVGDVRLCWTVGGAPLGGGRPYPFATPMPASNYPGVPAGGASILRDASALTGGNLTVYALNARILAWLEEANPSAPPSCAQVACSGSGDCLGPGNYFALPPIALQPSVFQVVALAGCLPTALDSAASTARCGTGWNATTGNLHADVVTVSPSSPSLAELNVQAVQLSPGLASQGAAQVSLGPATGPQTPIATLTAEGQLQPAMPATVAVGSDLSVFGQIGVGVDVAGAGAGSAGHLWMSLAQAQSLVDPAADPTQYFGQSATYVVAVVGDPAAPHAFDTGADGGYDGTGLHALVLPAAGR